MSARDHIGLRGPEFEVDVERGHVYRFARAMSAPLPEFVDGRRPLIPATFLVSAPYTWGYSLERPRGTAFAEVGHDLSVSLHAEEAFRFHGEPPRAGDRLRASSSLDSVVTRAGRRGGSMTFLTVLTEYRDGAGEIRVEQRSTSVTTDSAPSSDGWQVELPAYDPDYPDKDPQDRFASVARAGWEQLRTGEGPGPVDYGPLLLGDIVRFQGVVGEDDPLHHDTAWAARHGYPGVFGLGTHLASLLAGYAAHWLDPAAVREFRARFRNVAWPGDRLEIEGRVERVYRDIDSDCRCAEIVLDCRRSDDETLVTVTMELVF